MICTTELRAPERHGGLRRPAGVAALACVLVCAVSISAYQLPPSQPPVQETLTVVIKSQYRRLTFLQDIQRIAVGDTEIVSAEVISSRELLLLGRETGRTTLI